MSNRKSGQSQRSTSLPPAPPSQTFTNINALLRFQKLLKRFNVTYRDLSSLHDTKAPDNDIEHSYRSAMLCWYIIAKYHLNLDLAKVLQYALIHDMVEIYAGDTSIYANCPPEKKAAKEHASFLRLQKEFPELKAMWDMIAVYEKRGDDEARFVYIVEKIEPILVVLLSEKDHWIKRKVSLDDFIDKKQRKLKNLDSFAQLFNHEMMTFLKRRKRMFYSKK